MLVVSEEVRQALAAGRPVVALESTIIAHGLPRPRNLQVALELEDAVRQEGAVPATIAVLDGQPRVGLDKEQLERVANEDGIRKLGHRDLPLAVAAGVSGATTVSATALLAAQAGVRVFATGGLGGVHREWTVTQDESADLGLLARTRITVVCAGVKSILDVPATLQRLETLGVAVAGYGTTHFPGFYLSDSGYPVDWTLESPGEVAAVMRAQDALDGPESALIVANPVPEAEQLDPGLHARVLADALNACEAEGVSGQAVTPFLLGYLVRHTEGASLSANLAAVRGNVRLAGRIAAAWGRLVSGASGPGGAPGGALLVVGDVVTDIVARHRGPLASGTDTAAAVRTVPGGAGANVACWAARRDGTEVRLLGKVGMDAAAWHERELATSGVHPLLVIDPEAPTGTVICLVDTGASAERTFLTDSGAALRLTPGDWSESLLDGVARLHLSGYLFFSEPCRALVAVAVESARARGVPVSVDPASAGFLTELGVDRFLELAEGVDVLLPSRDEACLLTGLPDPADAAAKLSRHVPLVVVKQGGAGALVARSGEVWARVPAVPATPVDTTGAGDAFTGAFLAALLAGTRPEDAAAEGCRAGARAVEQVGGRPPTNA